jgi:hypothetical protein
LTSCLAGRQDAHSHEHRKKALQRLSASAVMVNHVCLNSGNVVDRAFCH